MTKTSQNGEWDLTLVISIKKNTIHHADDTLKTSIMNNRGGQKVIEHILSAYGFTSRQAFCNHLGISQSTMANRYARDTFPADWVLICSLETGASVERLFSGKSATKTDSSPVKESSPLLQKDLQCSVVSFYQPNQNFPIEIKIRTNEGGKAAIERLVNAYGFQTRKGLADHLRISKSTLANRYLRDTFPSDWIIRCALETGASLLWLTNGTGPKLSNAFHSVSFINKQQLAKGVLQDEGYIAIVKSLLATGVKESIAISFDNAIYIVDTNFNEISDGDWLVEIEGKFHIKKLTRKPVGKVIVSGLDSTFKCQLNELKIFAKRHSVFINYN